MPVEFSFTFPSSEPDSRDAKKHLPKTRTYAQTSKDDSPEEIEATRLLVVEHHEIRKRLGQRVSAVARKQIGEPPKPPSPEVDSTLLPPPPEEATA